MFGGHHRCNMQNNGAGKATLVATIKILYTIKGNQFTYFGSW
jgi:hypothetical protein